MRSFDNTSRNDSPRQIMTAQIIGSMAWRALAQKRVLNERVLLSGCGNIHLSGMARPELHSSTVFVTGCDKNFPYYWLRPSIFPRVKTLYLDTHPCEFSVIERFPQADIFLNERFKRYNNVGMRVRNLPYERMRTIIEQAQTNTAPLEVVQCRP